MPLLARRLIHLRNRGLGESGGTGRKQTNVVLDFSSGRQDAMRRGGLCWKMRGRPNSVINLDVPAAWDFQVQGASVK